MGRRSSIDTVDQESIATFMLKQFVSVGSMLIIISCNAACANRRRRIQHKPSYSIVANTTAEKDKTLLHLLALLCDAGGEASAGSAWGTTPLTVICVLLLIPSRCHGRPTICTNRAKLTKTLAVRFASAGRADLKRKWVKEAWTGDRPIPLLSFFLFLACYFLFYTEITSVL